MYYMVFKTKYDFLKITFYSEIGILNLLVSTLSSTVYTQVLVEPRLSAKKSPLAKPSIRRTSMVNFARPFFKGKTREKLPDFTIRSNYYLLIIIIITL